MLIMTPRDRAGGSPARSLWVIINAPWYKKTVEIFVARAIRLYQQEPGEACTSARLGLYVRRWAGWAHAGLEAAVTGDCIQNHPQQPDPRPSAPGRS